MDNRISLYEYLSGYRSIDEKRQVFFSIFKKMHQLHNNGEYLFHLSFHTISVCFTNPTDIHFSSLGKIGNIGIKEVLDIKFQNILAVSQMMICSFMQIDTSVPYVDLDTLTNGLSTLKNTIPSDDYAYFEKVLLHHEYVYYDDYIRELGDSTFVVANSKEEGYAQTFLLVVNLVIVMMVISCIFLYVVK